MRASLLALLLLGPVCWAASWLPTSPPPQLQQHWDSFQRCFISPEGRVVDTGNGNISHSEGQGYAMLMASAVGSEQQFERLWQWTQANLQQRSDDKLLIWKWRSDTPHTPDLNNASDGDIAVAWALLRAAERWRNPHWRQQALELITHIEQSLLRQQSGDWWLLPGVQGFEHAEGTEYNLAYWLYPALVHFSRIQPQSSWQQLIDSGLQLTRDSAAATELGLPADWLLLTPDGELQQSGERRGRFGYEAIRIPLYLCWARGCNQVPDTLRFWLAQQPEPPAWVDIHQQAHAPYPLSHGAKQIRTLLLQGQNHTPPQPCSAEQPGDYYSAVLAMLAVLASHEQSDYSL
ncbi:endoglucanase [Bacterioplanes sanyensis]|uniref:cellulase n=1 Tax=Bacterioplanes sanyensis TaxID=1249553 RepID=A0A222FHP0_9GAMM|nr:glycosyl hydrolase family 8 [Bacterioplanes sanyensis]ASP37994.1 endoglucanase [Bacterioplanes sanyensis]